MKENELVELGFEKFTPDPEDWNGEEWYYYTLDLGNGAISLITPGSNEIEDDKWYAEIFEDETIRFTSKIELMQFITIVKRNTIKK